MDFNWHDNKRFFIKIRMGKDRGMSETVYYRTDLKYPLFSKWMWYFEYRAALYRVMNPKAYIELFHGNYERIPPIEEKLEVIKNNIKSKKGKITTYENSLRMYKSNWTEIFSIEEDPSWIKACKKLADAKIDLDAALTYQKRLQEGENVPEVKRQNDIVAEMDFEKKVINIKPYKL